LSFRAVVLHISAFIKLCSSRVCIFQIGASLLCYAISVLTELESLLMFEVDEVVKNENLSFVQGVEVLVI
jgi:hypothetical protein